MTLFRMFDAAYPPPTPFPGCDAVAGYIGGNTPHVWTAAEWNAASGQGKLRQLPIWVGFGNPAPRAEQAQAAAAAMLALGWRPHALSRRVVALDQETSKDAAFVAAFTAAIRPLGYGVWPYGSESDIFSLPSEDGYWVALYDGNPALEWPVIPVMAHQFAADVPWEGGAVDLSVVSGTGMTHLGIGLRRLP